MNLPFKTIERSERRELPNLSASAIGGEYWNAYLNIIGDEVKISDDLSDIFDKGSTIHLNEEDATRGSRNITSSESYLKAIHDSELFTVSGLHDYVKFTIGEKGERYLEDLKSCKPNALYFFQKDGIKFSERLQLSTYGLLHYVDTNVVIRRGVITKINKEDVLDRASKPTTLIPPRKMAELIENHPVILAATGKITVEELYLAAFEQLKALDPDWAQGDRKEPWICVNCSRDKPCELFKYLKEEELLML